MNIALHSVADDDYYIASLKRQNADGYLAIGKRVTNDGRLISIGQPSRFPDKSMAERRVRSQIKIKMKRRGWQRVNLESLPAAVVKFLEVPPEMHVTPEELVIILREAKDEKYVVFEDVTGIEEYFDAGVEYLGYVTSDEKIVKVFDRYGKLRDCFTHRLLSMKSTEWAIEAKSDKFSHFEEAMKERNGK